MSVYGHRSDVRSIIGALRSQFREEPRGLRERREAGPFVTIARQAGAGGTMLAEHLAEALNRGDAEKRWRVYDKELIEKVAADHKLDADLVASLPDRPHSQLEDLAEGMRFDRSRPTDEYVYGRVIATIRALARMGHAIIVGRGGVYCTQDIGRGVHVQLIAPVEARVELYAKERGIEHERAMEEVERVDQRRDDFYRRFWPDAVGKLDRFSMVINTEKVGVEQQVAMVAAMVPGSGSVEIGVGREARGERRAAK